MVNEIAKLYSEGATLHQAIHRGVGQQAQRIEKEQLWKIVEKAVNDYECIYKHDIGIKTIEREFNDRSIVDFLFGWADEMEYQTENKHEDSLALNALVISRLLIAILEGTK